MDDTSGPFKTSPIADEADIAYCFRLLLQREPSTEEWKGHRALAGSPLAAVAKCYTDSPEFALIAGRKPGNAARQIAFPQFSMLISDDDLAVGVHVAKGAYEPQVAEVFKERLHPGMTVLDLGANIGYFTMLSAGLVGPSGCVIAVEPNLGNVRLLEASRRLNQFDHVQIIPCALGSALGMLSLQTAYSNGVTAPLMPGGLDELSDLTIVPAIPLSVVLPADRKVDFVKIDVEGAEHTVLSTCARLFQSDRPVIVSEFSPALLKLNSGVTPQTYLHAIVQQNYTMSIVGQQHTEIETLSVEEIMAIFDKVDGDHIDLVFQPM